MNEMKVITSVEEIDKEKWDEFVFNHPNGNFFQTPKAIDFFIDIPGYQPILFVAKENTIIKGVVVAVIMKESGVTGFFSRRCIVWGGPLCYDEETLEILLSKLIAVAKAKGIYLEFRNLFDMNNSFPIFAKKKFDYIEWLNYIVSIDGIDENMNKLNSSKKRQILKSLKAGAKITEAQTLEQVKDVYVLLAELYKDKIKKPLPAIHFFEKFFLSKNIGKIFVVENENKIIGGAVCPIYKDRIYELYVCGLDREIKNVYPSALATWAPIDYAAKNGLKYFDFMGAGSPNTDYGVREFKSQFGGELVSYGRYLRINNRLMYQLGKLVINIRQKIK